MALLHILRIGDSEISPILGAVITSMRREPQLYSVLTNRLESVVKSQHISLRRYPPLPFGISMNDKWVCWGGPFSKIPPDAAAMVDDMAAWSYLVFKILKELPEDTIVECWVLGVENDRETQGNS